MITSVCTQTMRSITHSLASTIDEYNFPNKILNNRFNLSDGIFSFHRSRKYDVIIKA